MLTLQLYMDRTKSSKASASRESGVNGTVAVTHVFYIVYK
jgi:hypothetical protein